ncbi:hypothetical protein Rsub_09569 [Raphidocelis subcapitata]|uniref:RRM domain-containing protein n=1 Tax=Raphidocelis subcapitata TaxID=307507 RepID=A0A2V0PC31_9CHLO|nr:hypothetical protein Rsub_09569 [Raphidocelis subcapitata]|eukprot:GBF97404.1 hypothetical protein Rsub_09569 [Raphidocelis subcapitata]
MVVMDVLAGLEELGFTEVPDSLASPLSSPDHCGGDEDGGRGGRGAGSAAEGCSVYVSNLAYAVSRAALARLFSACGDVRRVSIPLDPAGRPQGHAYVEFATPMEAQAALGIAGTEVGGRPLRVSLKRSASAASKQPGPAASAAHQHQHRASEPGSGRHGGVPGSGRQPRANGGGRARQGGAHAHARGRVTSDDASYYGAAAAPRHTHHSLAKAAAAAAAAAAHGAHPFYQPDHQGAFSAHALDAHAHAHASAFHHHQQQQHGQAGALHYDAAAAAHIYAAHGYSAAHGHVRHNPYLFASALE